MEVLMNRKAYAGWKVPCVVAITALAMGPVCGQMTWKSTLEEGWLELGSSWEGETAPGPYDGALFEPTVDILVRSETGWHTAHAIIETDNRVTFDIDTGKEYVTQNYFVLNGITKGIVVALTNGTLRTTSANFYVGSATDGSAFLVSDNGVARHYTTYVGGGNGNKYIVSNNATVYTAGVYLRALQHNAPHDPCGDNVLEVIDGGKVFIDGGELNVGHGGWASSGTGNGVVVSGDGSRIETQNDIYLGGIAGSCFLDVNAGGYGLHHGWPLRRSRHVVEHGVRDGRRFADNV